MSGWLPTLLTFSISTPPVAWFGLNTGCWVFGGWCRSSSDVLGGVGVWLGVLQSSSLISVRISPMMPDPRLSHLLGSRQSSSWSGMPVPQNLSLALSIICLFPVQWIRTSRRQLFWRNFWNIPGLHFDLAISSQAVFSKLRISQDNYLAVV